MNKKNIPFFILGIISFLILTVTFFQRRQKTLLLLLSSIGIAYVFEYFVLNIFKMYRYFPNVFKNKWIDSVFGALLSQSVFVPIVATYLALNNRGWKWRIGASLLFGIIERLFIKLRLFKNKTWKTSYTIISLPFYFFVVKKWWEGLQIQQTKIITILSVFFCYWVNYTNVYFFLLAFSKKFFFRIGFLRDKYQEHFILLPMYTFYQAIMGALNTLYFQNQTKLFNLLWLHLSDQLLFRLKIIRSKKSDLYMSIPIHLFIHGFGEYYHYLIKKNKASSIDE
jgi:hypothetical protein